MALSFLDEHGRPTGAGTTWPSLPAGPGIPDWLRKLKEQYGNPGGDIPLGSGDPFRFTPIDYNDLPAATEPPPPMNLPPAPGSQMYIDDQGNTVDGANVRLLNPATGQYHWVPNTPEGRAAFETLNPAPAAAPGAPGSGLPGDMTSSATGGFNPWMFNAQMDEAKRRNDLANATAQGSQESGFVIIDGKPVSWLNYSRGYDDEGNAIGTSKAGFQAGPDMFVVNGLDNTGANLGANQGAFVFQPR